MDIEQRMRDALHDAAGGLDLPSPGPESARRRALRRQRRSQATAGGLTALVVAVVGITGWQLLPDASVRLEDGGALVASGPGGAPDAAATAPAIDSLGALEWRDADAVVGSSSELLYSSADGAYYALSTAPGTKAEDYPDGDAPQALYRSDDGLTWDSVDLGEDRWIADLGERGGVLYAVSTAPATAGTGWGRAAVSTDGGQTWSQVDLPGETVELGADVPVARSITTAGVAVGDEALLARKTTTHHIEISEVFTDQELESGYVTETAEGLALKENGCVVEMDEPSAPEQVPDPADPAADEVAAAGRPVSALSGAPADCSPEADELLRLVTWAEIGIEGRGELRRTELFRSEDGQTWETLDASAFDGLSLVELTAGPHGFLAITWAEDEGTRVLRSSDGADWSQIAVPGDVTGLGFVGDRIVGYEGGYAAAVASEDGGQTWTRTDLGEFLGIDVQPAQPSSSSVASQAWVQAYDTGPLGAAAIISTHDQETVEAGLHLAVSPDGINWTVSTLGEAFDEGTPDYVDWVAVGADSITMSAVWSDDDGDEPRTIRRTVVGTPTR